ncbi:MAG: hypothetical protein KUG68_00535 [Flavobacteriaceae bacterium]|nr:hypothetical protein [Flavobacteriaceae bacterium]
MKKNDFDTLFNKPEGAFDIEKTPTGHKARFLDKLNTANDANEDSIVTNNQTNVFQLTWKKALSVAAIVLVIFTASPLLFNQEETTADLASVSPEMEETQSFFTTSINKELQKLKSFNNPDAKLLVEDALKQIEVLENQYEDLKTDLVESGNDKRVIYAMITNFQNRIELLEEVILKIEDIKNLNTQNNENII